MRIALKTQPLRTVAILACVASVILFCLQLLNAISGGSPPLTPLPSQSSHLPTEQTPPRVEASASETTESRGVLPLPSKPLRAVGEENRGQGREIASAGGTPPLTYPVAVNLASALRVHSLRIDSVAPVPSVADAPGSGNAPTLLYSVRGTPSALVAFLEASAAEETPWSVQHLSLESAGDVITAQLTMRNDTGAISK